MWKCKCQNKKCFECTQESLELDLCISCNYDYGYYSKSNEKSHNSKFVNCYKSPEGYYFDNKKLIYMPCYHSCKFCIDQGNYKNHSCLSCNSLNEFKILNEEDNETMNCYPDCLFNYYFDNKSNYICIEKRGCLPEVPFLVNGTKECVKSCNITKNKIQFRHHCYKQCPDDSKNISEQNSCKSICTLEAPFELVEEEICVSSCTIMERFYKKCITNYDGNRTDEVHDLIMLDMQSDIIDTFDYSFLFKENQSIVIEEDNILYEIISTNMTTKNNKISRIKLGKCENLLKEYYGIDKNESLYILKVDKNIH